MRAHRRFRTSNSAPECVRRQTIQNICLRPFTMAESLVLLEHVCFPSNVVLSFVISLV